MGSEPKVFIEPTMTISGISFLQLKLITRVLLLPIIIVNFFLSLKWSLKSENNVFLALCLY